MTVEQFDKCSKIRNDIKECKMNIIGIKKMLLKESHVNFWGSGEKLCFTVFVQDKKLIRRMCFLALREYKQQLKKLEKELEKY